MATPTSLPATFVSGNVLTAAQMNDLRGAFRILQVAQAVKSDTFSASIANGASSDITGLSVSITPSATSSKVLVIAQVNGSIIGTAAYAATTYKIIRDSTDIGIGDAASSRSRVSASVAIVVQQVNSALSSSVVFLDSPATTSATTYKLALVNATGFNNGTSTMYVNRTHDDTNANTTGRPISSITVMEISA
jgi:hypothetical protein